MPRKLVLEGTLLVEQRYDAAWFEPPVITVDGTRLDQEKTLEDLEGRRVRVTVEEIDADPA